MSEMYLRWSDIKNALIKVSENLSENELAGMDVALSALEKLSSADVVEVVWCADCSHRIYKDMGGEAGVIGGCELYGCATPNNHYCSFGVKAKVVLDDG